MAYIGRQNLGGAYRQLDDISSGFDGSDTTHTMQVNSANVTVGDVNQIILSLGGVIQKPGTDFTVSGSVLTFTTAPAANTSFFAVLLGSDNGGTVTPTAASVTTAKIVDDAVTGAKQADDIAITTTVNVSVDDFSFIFNESSASVDFRIETNGQTHALFADGSADAIGLFNSAPSFTAGPGIHLPDDVKIGFGTGGSSRPDFQLNADSSNLKLACGFGSDTADININTSGTISTGQETAPDTDGGGLVLNQGANDTFIMSVKNSDVAHAMTGVYEADNYFILQKHSAANGGTRMVGIAEDDPGFVLRGFANTSSGSVNSSTNAMVHIDGAMSDGGTSVTQISSNNLVMFSNNNSGRVILTGAGNIYSDASSTVSTFDHYDDAQLVRAWDLTHKEGVIDSKFDKFVKYNHEKLAELELVGREDDGTPNMFVNVTGFQKLHNGAIWQQYEKHQRLAEAVYEMAKEALGEDKADAILEKHDIKLLN